MSARGWKKSRGLSGDASGRSDRLYRLVRICVIYDCLFPYTVGGAERWYRNLAERLAAKGHEVSYITLRQWPRRELPSVPGVRAIAVGPRMDLYTAAGRRRILPPLVFGIGVLWHLLLEGRRYDVVHTASFPYFSLLAAAAARPPSRFRLVVDWHEVWSRDYWIEYLGVIGGRVGYAVQAACLRIPQRAFCFSRLHSRRLDEMRLGGELTVLEGQYAGPLRGGEPRPAEPTVVFAGRHIPEKRVPSIVPALAIARQRLPTLRGEIFGDGPDRAELLRVRQRHGLEGALAVHGFVDAERVEDALRTALCMVLPSRREGYGMVVIEAAAQGTPSVVVSDPDNAAAELMEEGENGMVAPTASPVDLAAAIIRVSEAGFPLRKATANWFRRNAERLSLERSLRMVVGAYAEDPRN
jgi:glycosyltransferase involved in cell wall biosynthesis